MKKVLSIIVTILLFAGVVGCIFGDDKPTAEEKQNIVYSEVSLNSLSQDLKDNAMAAKDTHKDNYYILTGYVSNIDNDGEYFSIDNGDDFTFEHYQIFVDEELREGIKSLKKDYKVTVKVRCKDVGEILGYTFDLMEW